MTDRNVATHPVALGHPEPFYWIGSDISPVGWSVEPIKGARQI
jgi:hypothetical protein